jgi:hypothetical protein
MLKPSNLSQSEIQLRIDTDQIAVTTWSQLHEQLSDMVDTQWIFRGVSTPEHYPIPSIGREKVFGSYKRTQEERLFRLFKDRAVSLMADSRLNDWDWLAYAQHLGVPTRLLDWTSNPLNALFFALEPKSDSDRLLYCVKYSQFIHEVEVRDVSPFDNRKEGRFTPPLLFDRIRAQRGLFTIHPDPTKIFYRSGMKVFRIPFRLVTKFRNRLFKYGVDYWQIYPDSYGLGQQLKWQFQSKIGLGARNIKMLKAPIKPTRR